MRDANEYGGIAQLGERLNGIQEVSGSIPLISTNLESLKSKDFGLSFVFSELFAVICRSRSTHHTPRSEQLSEQTEKLFSLPQPIFDKIPSISSAVF